MVKYYRFAGVEVAVHIPQRWMYSRERHLAPFLVDQVQSPQEFYYESLETLPAPQGEKLAAFPDYLVYTQDGAQVRYLGPVGTGWEHAHTRIVSRGNTHRIQLKAEAYPNGIYAKTVLNTIQTEHLVARAGGFVFHCAYIEHNGKAILFTAPSGTGKSTQAELWQQYRGARIINGDRAAVRITSQGVIADGIPYAGSSQYCENKTLPLAAVVYLAQAPQTSIWQLRGVEAFRRVWEGVSVNTWDKKDMSLVMDAVQQMVSEVPVYYLSCTPDESAVSVLERMLESRK